MVELAVSKLLVDSDAAKLRLGNTASFEMSQRWLIVGNSVYDLTCPRYKSPALRLTNKRVTARPTGRLEQFIFNRC